MAIERFLGKTMPRVILPDFDYKRRIDDKARAAGIEGSSRPRSSREGGSRDGGSRSASRDHGSRDQGRSRPARTGGDSSGRPQTGGGDDSTFGRRPSRGSTDRRSRRKM